MSANKKTDKISYKKNHQWEGVQCCQTVLFNFNKAVINVLLIQYLCCCYSSKKNTVVFPL